jgi:amidase
MVDGFKCSSGTQGWQNFVANWDAFCIRQLKDSGAVILGLTNVPELLTAYETDNKIYGRTNNPYDLSKTPGGSSGGEASIIAAGGSILGLGTDAGGSIRVPAHFCGIAGFKPTQGLVSRFGIHMPARGIGWVSPFGTIGPMARYVDDLSLIMPLLAKNDFRDPYCFPVPFQDPNQVDLKGLRVAYYTEDGFISCQHEIQEIVKQAADALANSGLKTTHKRPEDLQIAMELMLKLFFENADGGKLHQETLTEIGTTDISSYHQMVIASGKENIMDTYQFHKGLEQVGRYRLKMHHFMEEFDVIICPPCATTAKNHGATFKEIQDFNYTLAYNLLGWPSVVVRCGEDKNGLPIGVQIIARPWQDHVALRVAKCLEQHFGGFKPAAI